MRYFLDDKNEINAIDEGQEDLIKQSWVELLTDRPSLYHTAVVEDGVHTGWEITPENTAKAFNYKKSLLESQIQSRLDDFANTKNYDGILSAASYVNSTDADFSIEGQYCVQLRDDTWAKAYQILAEVEAGTRPEPDSIEDFENELPAMVWPN